MKARIGAVIQADHRKRRDMSSSSGFFSSSVGRCAARVPSRKSVTSPVRSERSPGAWAGPLGLRERRDVHGFERHTALRAPARALQGGPPGPWGTCPRAPCLLASSPRPAVPRRTPPDSRGTGRGSFGRRSSTSSPGARPVPRHRQARWTWHRQGRRLPLDSASLAKVWQQMSQDWSGTSQGSSGYRSSRSGRGSRRARRPRRAKSSFHRPDQGQWRARHPDERERGVACVVSIWLTRTPVWAITLRGRRARPRTSCRGRAGLLHVLRRIRVELGFASVRAEVDLHSSRCAGLCQPLSPGPPAFRTRRLSPIAELL